MAFKDTVKEWFKTGLKPTQAQFWAFFDFLRWKDEKIPIADIEQIEDILNAKAEAAVVTNHLTSATAHATEFNAKEDKANKGEVNGYAPLNEFALIAAQYLSIVNDLVTGGSTSLASAETVKTLKGQIDAIQLLLAADDVNLDTVQEIIDAIKAVETSLETILVNDLTTGGTTKALTAEMGKTLKGLIDGTTNNKVSLFIKSNESLTNAGRKGDVLYGILDQYTGEEITLLKVTGTPTVDNIIYFQMGGEYFKRNFEGEINVKWFGAVGDGVSDDAVAINRATKYVAGLGGGTVYYPSGVYRITRAIRLDDYDIETLTYSGNIRRNIVHKGASRDATTIIASGFWTSIFTSFPEPFIESNAIQPFLKSANDPGVVPDDEFTFLAENIVIDGLTLDCDYNTNIEGAVAYGSHYATWGGTWPNGSISASFFAADNYQYPVYAYNVRGFFIQNCIIKNSWFNGIEIYRCHDVIIDNNTIQNCGDKANYLGYYSGVELDNASYRCRVTGNIIKNTGTGLMSNGDTLSYVWRAVQDIIVTNNIFDTTHNSGIYAFDWVSDWQIYGNSFINIGSGPIEFATNATPVAGRQPQYCKISGNILRSYNTRNLSSITGIRVLGSGMSVCDNSIFAEDPALTANHWGIVASPPGTAVPVNSSFGIIVANNYLCGRFQADSEINGGAILAGSKYCQVIGNTIISTAAVARTAIMIAADDVKVDNNDVRGAWIFGSGKKAIFYNSGLRPYMKDAIYGVMFDISTGTGHSGLTGWNVVDFTNYTPTTYDNRGNFNGASNAFVVDIPGLYRFTACSRFNGVGSPATPISVIALLELNGATGFGGAAGWSLGYADLAISVMIELNVGDFITLKTYCADAYTVESGTKMHVERIQ